jgi:hypothetical protein
MKHYHLIVVKRNYIKSRWIINQYFRNKKTCVYIIKVFEFIDDTFAIRFDIELKSK